MTLPLAFRATYADWKLIKTRGVVQVVMEVPLADSDAAYDVLGGMPNPANETWFGIAPIKIGAEVTKETTGPVATPRRLDKPAGAKREWRDMPPQQQAGIRINEATFAAYLRERHPEEWRETQEADACLKMICQIESKRDLSVNHAARTLWHQIDDAYQAWKALENA